MAACNRDETVRRVPTLVSSLSMDVLERLGMKLNPRHLMKDFRYLAGKMNYNYEMVRNIERQRNPTIFLLNDWFMTHARNGEPKTVTDLIELLKDMQRDDAVDLLKPVEFTVLRPQPHVNNLSDPRLPHNLPPVLPVGNLFGAYSTGVLPPQPHVNNLSDTHLPHNLPPVSPVGNLFGAYSTGDLKETRPPQENEYLYNNNLSSNGYHNNYAPEGTGSYQDLDRAMVANIQQTSMFYNIGAPQASEPTPQVRRPATDQRNGSPQGETNGTLPVQPANRQPWTIPDTPSRPVVSDKVALVIGNQQYERKELQGLFYPEKDAYDVAKALGKLQFKVVSLVNLTLSEMRVAMLAFCRMLGKGVYGVLYYAGHAYEDGGENFLLPVDANLKYNRQDSLRAQEILETMQECDTALNLLIIDSCRIRLPNKCGSVRNCKRGPKGNNIFAYSWYTATLVECIKCRKHNTLDLSTELTSCSQQEAYEAPGQRNGLYALHLLRKIEKDDRIEHILMDVARDVHMASNRNLIQRPCHESDAVADCRLSDPIQDDARPAEYVERVKLWTRAHNLPERIQPINKNGIVISFECQPMFSNVMDIKIMALNTTPVPLSEVVMELIAPHPVKAKVRLLSGAILLANGGKLQQVVQLSRLQKLLDPLEVTFRMYYNVDDDTRDWEAPVRLECPLVSSVFVQWDWWITCGRLPGTKNTQV